MLTRTVMVLISYYVYPLSLCEKKWEYFLLNLVFRPKMYFQTGHVFLSQNSQMGSLLVFFIGYILDKTKTLYVMVAF
jgi:hypothetical protein